MSANSGSVAPVDGTTYYFGSFWALALGTSADAKRKYFLKAGTIKAVHYRMKSEGGVGTNENISAYIRINNTTDYLIATVGTTDTWRKFYNEGLNIPVTTNDYFEIKVVCPTWATNPGTLYSMADVLVECE
jgi:hypothetical protein